MNLALRFAGLVALLALCGLAGCFVGGSSLGAGSVLTALLHPALANDTQTIVWALRVPRVAIAMTVGGSLATAGFLLQGLLRNPLVDPFLTGVSAGSGAAIVIALALHAALPLLPGVAFVAGLGTALVVAALARRGSGLDTERLILAGVSISALLSAIVAIAMQRLDPLNTISILAWLAGSVGGRGWNDLAAVLPYTAVGVALAVATVPALNALRLGTNVARAVGVDVVRAHWTILIAASLLTAGAVTLGGVIGFVGLIVPHLARRFVGTDSRVALFASLLIGAAIVPLADAASRAIAPPGEVPLGALLAIAGVPAFLYLYARPAGRRGLWGA